MRSRFKIVSNWLTCVKVSCFVVGEVVVLVVVVVVVVVLVVLLVVLVVVLRVVPMMVVFFGPVFVVGAEVDGAFGDVADVADVGDDDDVPSSAAASFSAIFESSSAITAGGR